ncbi:MAG: AraC family transcriptional regulator [Bacillota bacterium]|nr:AraC family transcriptional regulator [Bacillota bacterium]
MKKNRTDRLQMTNPDDFYRALFEKSGFYPCDVPDGFPPVGECWALSPEIGSGYYWYYEAKDRYNIKIHDFRYRKDTVIEASVPECLSVTWYDSISGEELHPYRKINCNVIKSFLGGYEPYRALIHRNVPIRSIGIEYRPAYYDSILRERFGDLYQNPADAFRTLDETAHFPEMVQLLRQLWRYRGEGLTATLYYDAKAAEALSLIFEHHRRLQSKKKDPISHIDCKMLESVASYIGDHYADALSIEMLSRIACMGMTKFKRCFKSYYDCTVSEYIRQVRIDRAEHLLAYTELSVGEVAKAVGYTASGHFAALFYDVKGSLPLEYRKMMQRQDEGK